MPLKDYDGLLSKDFGENAKIDAAQKRNLLRERIKKANVPKLFEAFEAQDKADLLEVARRDQVEITDTQDGRSLQFIEDARDQRRSPSPNLGLGSHPPLTPSELADARESAERLLDADNAFRRRVIREAVFAISNPALEALVEQAELTRNMAESFNRRGTREAAKDRSGGGDRGDA